MELIDLEGVGDATAEKLKEAGYTTVDTLVNAESDKLLELGITQQTIDNLIEQGLLQSNDAENTSDDETPDNNNNSTEDITINYKQNNKDHILIIDGEKIQFSGGIATVNQELADKIIKKDDYSIAKQG